MCDKINYIIEKKEKTMKTAWMTPNAVCVFEFKYAKSAKAAIRQIRERGYADKWVGGERPVTLVGINFNPRKRNIDLPVIEPA